MTGQTRKERPWTSSVPSCCVLGRSVLWSCLPLIGLMKGWLHAEPSSRSSIIRLGLVDGVNGSHQITFPLH
ncbi:hypothetical protein BJX66DRAFT_314109 [Aspergillus keveii]|uniref:Secreted protein n=1 Tax=Aspergillus keveii TaxID=714993 RepID=A0ABR4FRC6_9EURO